MNSTEYIGMDAHKENISIAMMDSADKWVMESVIETKASTILHFIHGLRGTLHVTSEDETLSAYCWGFWLSPWEGAVAGDAGFLVSALESGPPLCGGLSLALGSATSLLF